MINGAAGPKDIREFFHYLWKRLGSEGGNPPTDPTDPVPPAGHVHDHRNLVGVFRDQHHPYFHFNTPYVVGQEYTQGDAVLDGGWTMVANKTTTDTAAPQPVGTPEYLYTGTSPTAAVTVRQIVFGTRFTSTSPFQITGYRVYTVTGNTYRVFAVIDPTGAKIISELLLFTANSDGWQEFTIPPSINSAGSSFDLVVIVDEPDPSPTTFSGDWDYTNPQNPGIPGPGDIVHPRSNPSLFSISSTDDNAGDRYSELATLQVGDVIDGAGVRWAIQSIADNTTYFDFGVAPAQLGTPTIVQTFTFETTVATPITRMEDAGYWAGEPRVSGLYIEDGDYSNIVVNDNAYGADVRAQLMSLSADWDVMAPAEFNDASSSITLATSSDLGQMATTIDSFTGAGNPNDRLDNLEAALILFLSYLRGQQ